MNTKLLEKNEEIQICKFCKQPLQKRTLKDFRGELRQVGWMDCQCEGAKKEREQREREERERKKREEENRIILRLQNGGVGEKYLNCRHENSSEFIQSIMSGSSLYFYSKMTGTGKSYAGCAILREIAEKTNLTFRFVEANELLCSLFSEGELFERCMGVNVLLIDDLGKEHTSNFFLSKLFELVSKRYNNERPMIITSNFSMEELKTRMANRVRKEPPDVETIDAIYSRLYEMSQIYNFEGQDKRLRTKHELQR